MPKEDYLIKYLEKLHRVIAAMLGWKETGDYEQAMKLADEITTETLQLHLQEILDMETEAFEQRVRKQNFGVNYLEKLCELLVVTTDTYYDLNRPKDMQEISKKTLILYRILNEKDKTFSFERESIISELEEISKNQLNK